MSRRSKTQELIDFEISFYEKLLTAYPDFVDAMIPLGNAYTRRGHHEKGLEVDLRITQLRGHDPLTWYNLACSYSLLKRISEALEALRQSVSLGYANLDYVRKDPDLFNLRQSPQYREFLESLIAKRAAAARRIPAPPTESAS